MTTRVRYAKPFLSYDEQLQQLLRRGLGVSDKKSALLFLGYINYYRLAGYCYHFESAHHPEHRFRTGITFDDLQALCSFDDSLRSVTLAGIRHVEIGFRSRLAYHLAGSDGDPFAHLDETKFRPRSPFCEVWASLQRAATRKAGRNAGDPRVRHFAARYVEFPDLPVWVAVEIASLGDLSKLYRTLRPREQKPLAQTYGLDSGDVLASWLHNVTQVRNQCAHHGRLWDFRFPAGVRFPKKWQPQPRPTSIYASFLCIYTMIRSWDQRCADAWRDDVIACTNSYLSECPLATEFAEHMGLLAGWMYHAAWCSATHSIG